MRELQGSRWPRMVVLAMAMILFASTRPLAAQELREKDLLVGLPSRSSDLAPRQLYAVDVVCAAPKAPDAAAKRALTSGWLGKSYTASHVVAISDKPPTMTDGKVGLPTSALIMVLPYAFSKEDDYRNLDCSSTYFVVGNKDLFFYTSLSLSSERKLKDVVEKVGIALKVAPPLLSLFATGGAATTVSTFISGAVAAADPFKGFLDTLRSSEKIVRSAPLKVGRYEVSTPFGSEFVNVRAVASLVQDRDSDFTRLLAAQLEGIQATLQHDAFAEKCRALRTELVDSGLSSPTDRGYAMVQVALKSGFDRDRIVDCLPLEEALAVARLSSEIYWRSASADQRFTEEHVRERKWREIEERGVVPQPIYDNAIENRLYRLVTLLSRGGRKGGIAASDLATLRDITAAGIDVVDDTEQQDLVTATEVGIDGFANALYAKGVNRFGCFARTDSGGLDSAGDGAIAAFLGFLVPRDATEGSKKQAVVLRPFFKEGRFKRFVMSREIAWIEALLREKQSCGQLAIVEPKKPVP